jgi:hypothetical protein
MSLESTIESLLEGAGRGVLRATDAIARRRMGLGKDFGLALPAETSRLMAEAAPGEASRLASMLRLCLRKAARSEDPALARAAARLAGTMGNPDALREARAVFGAMLVAARFAQLERHASYSGEPGSPSEPFWASASAAIERSPTGASLLALCWAALPASGVNPLALPDVLSAKGPKAMSLRGKALWEAELIEDEIARAANGPPSADGGVASAGLDAAEGPEKAPANGKARKTARL